MRNIYRFKGTTAGVENNVIARWDDEALLGVIIHSQRSSYDDEAVRSILVVQYHRDRFIEVVDSLIDTLDCYACDSNGRLRSRKDPRCSEVEDTSFTADEPFDMPGDNTPPALYDNQRWSD